MSASSESCRGKKGDSESGRTAPGTADAAKRLAIAPDGRLVSRARGGDRRAFEILWNRYVQTVHGILMSMMSDQEAEDLMQDVALAALRSIEGIKQPDRFAAWLSSIARNIGRDALRARIDHEPLDTVSDDDGAIMPSSAEPPSSAHAEANEILDHIRALPECYREPLTLRLVLQLSGPEIAVRTGMTPGSVRVNLYRGLKLLRERLEREKLL
jgi:RNA polymerase sigma-70 factor (ECF subfamily)